MPVTYEGAIKKKTRRRRILPKTFRKHLQESDISLFECLSLDQIKKIKSAHEQHTEVAEAAVAAPDKENNKCRVRFEKPDCGKKSLAVVPGSANSTFDKILKQTPLQPQQRPTSSKSFGSSSGSSVELGAAHHYFTRCQASGNASGNTSSNAECDRLYRSLNAASPDCIPDTPVCAVTKPKRKPLSVRQNICSSAAPSTADYASSAAAIFLQAQVTSTPIMNPAFTANKFSISPLSTQQENRFLSSNARACAPECDDATIELSSLLEKSLSLSRAGGTSDVDGSLHVGGTSEGTSPSRLSAPDSESAAGSCVSTSEGDRVPSGSCGSPSPLAVSSPGEEQRHSHKISPGMPVNGQRGSSQLWTPRRKRNRLSHFVVVDDAQLGPGKCHDSSFRSVHDGCAGEADGNSAMFSPARLGVASLSPAQEPGSLGQQVAVTARDLVLQKCGQQAPIAFSRAFSKGCLRKCKKIGEGVYGEVYLCERGHGGARSVLKIIPIEGDQLVNGAVQKKYKEILSEIIIAMELSSLRAGTSNATSAFSEVLRCICVQGKYPKRLVELWDQFHMEKTSENDSPTMFDSTQLFIILELSHAGSDLEAFVFSSAHQGLSVFKQVMCGLAVAELQMQFEHRDLHWGNVLVAPTTDQTVSFTLRGRQVTLPTRGVKATIIDFTLSRVTYEGCHIFCDLSLDPELFVPLDQCQDYQFQIYTLMRIAVEDDWKRFEPKTNVYWLHYLCDKLIHMARYVSTRTRVHSTAKLELQHVCDCCLSFDSAADLVVAWLQAPLRTASCMSTY